MASHESGAASLREPLKSRSCCPSPAPYRTQGDCVHVPCSVPQFPHSGPPLLPRGSSGLWSPMLNLFLNMLRVLPEYSQPNSPMLHTTSPGEGN